MKNAIYENRWGGGNSLATRPKRFLKVGER